MAIKCWHVPALETVLFSRTENRTQRIREKNLLLLKVAGKVSNISKTGPWACSKTPEAARQARAVMKWVGEAKAGSGPAPAARGGHAGVSVGNSCYFFGGADR